MVLFLVVAALEMVFLGILFGSFNVVAFGFGYFFEMVTLVSIFSHFLWFGIWFIYMFCLPLIVVGLHQFCSSARCWIYVSGLCLLIWFSILLGLWYPSFYWCLRRLSQNSMILYYVLVPVGGLCVNAFWWNPSWFFSNFNYFFPHICYVVSVFCGSSQFWYVWLLISVMLT